MKSKQSHKNRMKFAGISALVGLIVVIVLVFALKGGSYMGKLLIDKSAPEVSIGNFFTVQAFMWIFFFIGAGELYLRLKWSKKEEAVISDSLLPENEEDMFTSSDLPPIYQKANLADDSLFLPRLIKRTIRHFQISKSVDQSNSLLNSSLELYLHEIDLRYNMLRYIMWFIPTLGFIGTVLGIAKGLNIAAEEYTNNGGNINLANITDQLGVAFYTTLLALVMSGILVFLMHLAQGREEGALNGSGQYCLDNLINKLYEK